MSLMAETSRHAPHLAALKAAAMALPPGHADSVARALERHTEPSPAAERALAVAQRDYRQMAGSLASAWKAAYDPVGGAPVGAAVSMALRVASEVAAAARAEESIEIVWTGPSTLEVPVRLTLQVIVQLARLSVHTLWLTSFSAYPVPLLLEVLRETAERGVDVRMVLETKEDSQGALSYDAAHAFKSIADRVALYVWPLDRRPHGEGQRASMHAKSVVADDVAAFVTSANLTGMALVENMELGLLVRGGPTPRKLARHYQSLVEQGVLQRVLTTGS
jgi:phosphatidylserine/phosphatidylglycerophosphate/cardiolipin synthase-like enzyme